MLGDHERINGALVIFHGHGTGFLSRFLKRGFKHCFVVVRVGKYWIAIDSGEGVPVIEVVAPSDFDFATFCRDKGLTVIETEQRHTVPRNPWAVANCVGCVKFVLCLRSNAITPYGLYQHLRREP